MDEFKWNSDDFQTNTTHFNGTIEGNATYSDESKMKIRNKFKNKTVKLPVAILAVVLAVAICISGFALVANSPKGGNAVLHGVVPSEDKSGDVTTVTSSSRKIMETPDIVDLIGPAVVGVTNITTYTSYFGESTQDSEGSGIVLTQDGYIVTNYHVIEGATKVNVSLNTGDEYEAKVIGGDAQTDLAIIKIDATDLTYATLGNSSELRVGEKAIAIGNPLGQEFAGTVTQGVISALNRSVTFEDKTLTLIQTDAAINPGNSGGALVNSYGEVIGINTAKIMSSELEGLGFAIPIDVAKPIIEDLIKFGYVKGRPLIGISGRTVTKRDAQAYGLVEGVYVVSVSEYSPAERAGIMIGDIITVFNGTTVTTVEEINDIKNKFSPGKTVDVKIWRQGKSKSVTLTLGENTTGQ